MRKLFIIIFILIIFENNFALEFWGEIDSEYRLQNFEKGDYPFEAKLGTDFSGDDFYSEFAIIGTNSESEESVEVYRASVEAYRDNFTIALGRQKLVWGSAFIFNLADVFNDIDLEEPRSEKIGTDSIKLKYNTDDMSRFEAALFKNDLSNNNFGTRYTFLSGNFEFMIDYFNYKQSMEDDNEDRVNNLIFEFKGDAGVGLWAQLGQSWGDSNNGTTIVLGSDYTFDAYGDTLYTLAEAVFNFDEDAGALYLTYRYDFTELSSLYQSALINPKGGSLFISTYISHIFNDYITTKAGVTFYDDMGEFGFDTADGDTLHSEVFLELELFF